jgi:hypothetical protein
MTENEWFACDDVRPMLDWLPTRPHRRLALWLGRSCDREPRQRLHRFAAACCARIAGGDGAPGDRELTAATLLGLGRIGGDEFEAVLGSRGVLSHADVTVEEWAGRWADAAARCVAWGKAFSGGRLDWEKFKRLRQSERSVQADLLRCVFGNPFRQPLEIDPDWLESEGHAARSLAREIGSTNDFRRLPDLADALEAAKCPDPDLAAHCRAKTVHALGCRVVELLAGGGMWAGHPLLLTDPVDDRTWRSGPVRATDGGRRTTEEVPRDVRIRAAGLTSRRS